MKLQLRAAIYVRVNTDVNAEQRLAEQEQRIREWAEPHYLNIVKVYSEMGSGAKEDRPVWLELLAAAEAGEFEVVNRQNIPDTSGSKIGETFCIN